MVNRSRNKRQQLVKDSYITELQRLNAIRDYNEWISKDGNICKCIINRLQAGTMIN